MPRRRMVDVQNFKPPCIDAGSLSVLAMSMPRMMAIMIELIGLLSKPSTDSPTQSAAIDATTATVAARARPAP